MCLSRFQVVVLSAYKQIQAQNVNVLSDIDEDNYDRAFAFLRPRESNCAWIWEMLNGSSHTRCFGYGSSAVGDRVAKVVGLLCEFVQPDVA
jgi:hypothetical protein